MPLPFRLTGTRVSSAVTALAMAVTFIAAPKAQAQNLAKFEEYSGQLPDGTDWMIRIPENWNGTLLRDLDFVSFINVERYAPRYEDLMARGYAFAGLARHPMRLWQYDPQREIRNLERVQDILVERESQPERVLQYGCSGGGLVSLTSAEDFADKIDGAVVLAAHGPVWIMSSFLDGWFVMKALLADDFEAGGLGSASDLVITALPNAGARADPSLADIKAAWQSAIKAAGETPEGRARLALAFAIGQWSPWMTDGTELPDLSNTADVGDMVVNSALRIAGHVGGTARLLFENAASGQQLSGNEGIDYAAFYENAAPNLKGIVEALYAEAGLDFAGDLKRVNAQPRIAASGFALDFWAEPGRMMTGHLQVPTIRLHLLGDWAVPYSLMQGYQTLVGEVGTTDLYRQSLVKGTGHCEFTAAESTTAVETLMARLDTGSWPATEPEALNAAAAELDTGTEARFAPYDGWRVGSYNRAWTSPN